MKTKLRDLLFPQQKSKIKAGEGKQEGKYKFFTSSPVQNKHIDVANYTKPALIFGTGGNASVHFCNEPFSTSTDCLVMFGRNEQELQTIYFFLRNNMHLLEGGFKGAGLKHISKEYILDLSIELPSSTVQQELLQKASSIESMVAKRKEQLAKLDTLVKSRFIELFGDPKSNSFNWKQEKLSSTMEVRGRVGWKGYKKEDLRNSGPLVLGATHLSDDGRIDLSEPVFLSEEKYFESPEIMVKQNDLIFAQRGSLGKVGLVETEYKAATINPCVLILRPIKINSQFARYYLMIQKDNGELDKLNSGSTIPMITQKSIGEFSVTVPPIELQNQFADFVKQTDKSKFEIQKSLEKLEILKKALMQQYFG